MLAGFTALVSWAFSRGPKLPPRTPIVIMLILLVTWTGITTLNAMYFADALAQWNLFLRLVLMVLIGIVVVRSQQQLHYLIWSICLAIGYFGAKTGLFSFMGGLGKDFVGPSFMAGNNELARGIIMFLPLLMYLFNQYKQIWVKAGIVGVAVFSSIALILSGSRGAWLGALAMVAFVAVRSRRGLAWILLGSFVFAAAIPLLPDSIVDRFLSISQYKTDASVQGRFDAWQYAIDKFPERPIMGGGFLVFDDEHKTSSHNSYVQALGEHGAVGLVLYVMLLIVAAVTSVSIRRRTAHNPALRWANQLAFLIQVSMVGYAVGSISITAAFFPVFYVILGVLASLQILVNKELALAGMVAEEMPERSLKWRAA
jgi:probable O-glycosylation ligase (exosortase A-associated)